MQIWGGSAGFGCARCGACDPTCVAGRMLRSVRKVSLLHEICLNLPHRGVPRRKGMAAYQSRYSSPTALVRQMYTAGSSRSYCATFRHGF